jgi:hypothetical protein
MVAFHFLSCPHHKHETCQGTPLAHSSATSIVPDGAPCRSTCGQAFPK